jgi:AcrR family transcriptional regulator
MRGIARGAGVDPRMILHFFGSKQALFTSTIDLPFEPEATFELLFAEGVEGIGRRVAEFILSVLDDPRGRSTVTGIIRAAVSEPEAAALVRELLTQRLLTPLARQVSHDRPELRASLIGAQVVGLVMARYVVSLEPLKAASHEDLVQTLTPVFEYYLLGDLPTLTAQGH